MLTRIVLPALASAALVLAQLDPNCRPGGNFNLKKWNLQLPTGSPGSPTTIPSSQLDGCTSGYTSSVFFTGEGGRLVTKVCGSPSSCGCVTTANSNHCRTELRESNPSQWSPNNAVNRLNVRVAVKALAANNEVAIGQILHNAKTPNKPVAEIYYRADGRIQVGVGQSLEGGDQQRVGGWASIEPFKFFDYELKLEGNKLFLSVNGVSKQLTNYNLNAPPCYFKAGNYNQGDQPTEVHFMSITTTHG